MTEPESALEAIFWALFQAAVSRPRRMEPSQAKLNWQPVRLPAPWNTTEQTLFGKAGWRTRFSTTWATAACPAGVSPRASK